MELATLRALSFALLCLQTASHTLIMRYSRGKLHERYANSAAVLCMEVIKVVICVVALWRTREAPLPFLGGASSHGGSVLPLSASDAAPRYKYHSLAQLVLAAPHVAIPAAVYFLQNTLAFVALSNLDPAVFSVLSQLKLLTAALFSMAMLGRRLSGTQWRNLVLLVVGVVTIILSAHEAEQRQLQQQQQLGQQQLRLAEQQDPRAPPIVLQPNPAPSRNLALGVVAVLSMSTTSGFAGVYVEKVLKSAGASMWARNLQLSVYSVGFGVLQTLFFDWSSLAEHGFFHGFSWVAWLTILIGALGGLLVAVVVKYADTVIKGFATSSSIILTSAAGWLWFDTPLTPYFVLGSFVVIISLLNYTFATDAQPFSASTDAAAKRSDGAGSAAASS
jgi:drug/metabolite transporter (DMT)-like permease